MFLHFSQALVLMPLDPTVDQGIKGRMLALLLLTAHLQPLSADDVDLFLPYFTAHQLSTPGQTHKGMITIHLKGTTSVPGGADVDELSVKAIDAVTRADFSQVQAECARAFHIEDGVPYASQRGHEFQTILGSVLSTLGDTRTVGRAPPGGVAKKIKGK